MALFHPMNETDVTKAIVRSFLEQFEEYSHSDVVIIGGGPSGLMAGRNIARQGKKVLIVERNNYIGGGFWIGGYLMNKVTMRAPADKVMDELGIPYEMAQEGLFVADGPHACSKLIAAACDAGVKFANMTIFEDIVLRENNRVAGAVINWTPIASLPREITCVDPVAIESTVMIDSTGHDACVVSKLEQRGIVKSKGVGAMWVDKSEDLIVEHTGKLLPGLIVAGMATSTLYGLPRMGPTFGGMLLSGIKAAECAIDMLKEFETLNALEKETLV